jgi:acetyl-CoA synthetase
MLRTIHGDDARFAHEYWQRIPDVYFAGDDAQCDKDGDLWLLGRVDDISKVAGHRLSSIYSAPILAQRERAANTWEAGLLVTLYRTGAARYTAVTF